jgi:ankyrin repeat protein
MALGVSQLFRHLQQRRQLQLLHQRMADGDLDAAMELLDQNPRAANLQIEELSRPLWDAVAWGKVDETKKLLDRGANVNTTNESGQTALHIAAESRSIESLETRKTLVELLLAKGQPFETKDNDGMTPLQLTARSSDELETQEVARILIGRGADEDILTATFLGDLHCVASLLDKDPALVESCFVKGGPRVLYWAALSDHYDIAKLLIARGANVKATATNGVTALLGAVTGNNNSEMVSLLLDSGATPDVTDEEGNPLIMTAVGRSVNEVISLLIERGADVNAPNPAGDTALHWATDLNISLLLDHGANPKAANRHGVTPLHRAAARINSTQLLVEKGADVRSVDDSRRTPLHCAAASGSIDVAQFLLRHGADINACDADGWTPLHSALGGVREKAESIARENEAVYPPGALVPVHQHDGFHGELFNCYPGIVKLLLASGANPNAKDKDGRTPLDWAVRVKSSGGCSDAMNLLREVAAKK